MKGGNKIWILELEQTIFPTLMLCRLNQQKLWNGRVFRGAWKR